MKTPYMKHLSPYPKRVDENGLAGELDIRYNSEDNYMLISFAYEHKDHYPAPLIVHVEVAGKRYRHELFISDYPNRVAKTALFRPDYSIWEGVYLYRISPLLTYAPRLVEEGDSFD